MGGAAEEAGFEGAPLDAGGCVCVCVSTITNMYMCT